MYATLLIIFRHDAADVFIASMIRRAFADFSLRFMLLICHVVVIVISLLYIVVNIK